MKNSTWPNLLGLPWLTLESASIVINFDLSPPPDEPHVSLVMIDAGAKISTPSTMADIDIHFKAVGL